MVIFTIRAMSFYSLYSLFMQVGEVVEYKGVKLRVEREKSEFSCSGCYLSITCSKNRTGCVASSSDKVFDSCKHDHVIFVRV